MERILGIDTGTNSLGWAIVDKEDGMSNLVAKLWFDVGIDK